MVWMNINGEKKTMGILSLYRNPSVALLVLLCSAAFVSSLGDEGSALMAIKSSLSNVVNVLLDWDNIHNSDYCSWKGVVCGNISLSVVNLNLSYFNLGGEISSAIGNLKNLQSLDLSGNKLSGQIPDEIGNCGSLTHLDLSGNLLRGDIPFSISKLKQLESLILKENQLSGPIPSTLTQIPNLKNLDLAQNHFIGEIPKLLYWNEVLQYLGLKDNLLSGTLSPDMCQLTGLWFFDVRGNNITGRIPDTIGNCTSFQILDISYNQITGEIPYNIGFLQVATLSLQGNKLSGMIPEVIGLMQALAVLDLSENELVGPIPPILGNLSYTDKLYLHSNKLTGTIPPELGNMSKLSYLQLNDNQLVGHIPSELGKLAMLFELNLANNYLEGHIPREISSCKSLNQLNVHGNHLNGSIPLSFRALESLTLLNLSSNNFKGRIPYELGRIINLDTLDLSKNAFSGPVPASVGDLEHLLKLNFGSNHLNGTIPSEFSNLKSIQILDMSFNNLTGSVPAELGLLQNMASLILNNNNLYGQIPNQLTNCLSLVVLNVSYNNLSGVVPTFRNFSRFPLESFIGNPLLCDNWVGSVCGPNVLKTKPLSRTAVIFIVLGLITLLFMAVIAIYKSNKQNLLLKGSNQTRQAAPKLVILHMDMAIHSYDDIMRLTENLSEKYVVGYGASSTVYKCELKNSRPIAIKRIYSQQNSREFETELQTISSIKHRNLVSLHGYSLSPLGNLLFYDFMTNGSLWDLLHGPSKKVKLDWDTRLRIAVGAAQGLSYLHHDCDPRIIHRDVKSSNILLDDSFEAHLSDFGTARCIPATKTHASTYVLGTIGYIDPEYARTSRLTEKSDIYSFGIVLLELLTGRKPVDDDSNLHQLIVSKADDDTVMEAVDAEVWITCMDSSHIKKAFQLALLCTRRYPLERPTMVEVSRVLISLLPRPPPKSGSVKQQPAVEKEKDGEWFERFREAISKNSLGEANPPASLENWL